MTMAEMIVRNKQGKVVGRIENHIFVKEVYGSKHMLRKPAAWAIDTDILDRAVAPNCYSIHIIDKETNKKYICGLQTFREHCQSIDRKFGRQYFLELVYWKVTNS